VPYSDYDIECIQKAKGLIDANLDTHFNLEFIATKVALGKTKLTRGFRKCYGMGLYSYLRQQRMIKAAELLAETSKTIKQVTSATGFKYSSNFTKTFTVYHGITPGEYRRLFTTNK
jgi:transcriptional regulator GlxA family with amidase domain